MAAEAMGVDNAPCKPAFAISAGYTGVGGALSAIAVQFVAPDSFTMFLSISLLVGVVVGGVGTLWGALFGALFIMFTPGLAEQVPKAAPWAVSRPVLIVFMFAMPGGVMGLLHRLGRPGRRLPGSGRVPDFPIPTHGVPMNSSPRPPGTPRRQRRQRRVPLIVLQDSARREPAGRALPVFVRELAETADNMPQTVQPPHPLDLQRSPVPVVRHQRRGSRGRRGPGPGRRCGAGGASAYFYLPFLPRLGIVPDLGTTWFIERRLGGRPGALGPAPCWATGLGAQQAADWGLVWACVDTRPCASRPGGSRLARLPAGPCWKPAARWTTHPVSPLEQQLHYEAERQRELVGAPAFMEGVQAFMQKPRGPCSRPATRLSATPFPDAPCCARTCIRRNRRWARAGPVPTMDRPPQEKRARRPQARRPPCATLRPRPPRLIACLALAPPAVTPVPAQAQKKYDTGASDTEIRIGSSCPTQVPCRPRNHGEDPSGLLRQDQRRGRHQRPQDHLPRPTTPTTPPRAWSRRGKLVERDGVLLMFGALGTSHNQAVHRPHEPAQGAPAVRLHGRHALGRSEELPWTMGWQPTYQLEGRTFAQHILATDPRPRWPS
ncbi:Voltage-dependent L-type calcium channel subunit alpha-1S [Manis javanica]|nr:Voltage-dependent L-type calcium channel subunit alpha-1S [Manis javanica]